MNKVMNKVRKLLALAFGSDGPEADSALAKAEELAGRHGFSLESIDFETSGKGQDHADGEDFFPESSALWRASLGWAVARYAGVKVIRHHRGKKWTVIGRSMDLNLWRSLFTRAEFEIDLESRFFTNGLPHGVSKKSEGDTFRKGAASGFGQRLQEWGKKSQGHSHAAPETIGTAMVLAGRDALVAAKTKELFPRLTTVSFGTGGSQNSWSNGRAFGKGMGVHRGNLK